MEIKSRSFVFLLLAVFLMVAVSAQARSSGKEPEKPSTAAQQKSAPQTGTGAQKTDAKGSEYGACSPGYPGEQIAEMMDFVAEISPQLPEKLKPILLKCDVDTNNQILGFIEEIQQEMATTEFQTEEQAKIFVAEKGKEIEAQLVLLQKPVNEGELKKILGDLFDMRQQELKTYLSGLEKEIEQIKKKLDDRTKLKGQIVDKKYKELAETQEEAAQPKSLTTEDPLAWE